MRLGLLWDKQHQIHIVRKSTLKLATFSSLVFIGPILKEIQPFNTKKYIDVRTMCQVIHISLINFQVYK